MTHVGNWLCLPNKTIKHTHTGEVIETSQELKDLMTIGEEYEFGIRKDYQDITFMMIDFENTPTGLTSKAIAIPFQLTSSKAPENYIRGEQGKHSFKQRIGVRKAQLKLKLRNLLTKLISKLS